MGKDGRVSGVPVRRMAAWREARQPPARPTARKGALWGAAEPGEGRERPRCEVGAAACTRGTAVAYSLDIFRGRSYIRLEQVCYGRMEAHPHDPGEGSGGGASPFTRLGRRGGVGRRNRLAVGGRLDLRGRRRPQCADVGAVGEGHRRDQSRAERRCALRRIERGRSK